MEATLKQNGNRLKESARFRNPGLTHMPHRNTRCERGWDETSSLCSGIFLLWSLDKDKIWQLIGAPNPGEVTQRRHQRRNSSFFLQRTFFLSQGKQSGLAVVFYFNNSKCWRIGITILGVHPLIIGKWQNVVQDAKIWCILQRRWKHWERSGTSFVSNVVSFLVNLSWTDNISLAQVKSKLIEEMHMGRENILDCSEKNGRK